MFQKKLFLSFRGNMHGRDQSYPGAQLAAWSVAKVKLYQRYFSATYLKLLTTSGTIAISCPLTYHVYCAVILYLIFSELFTKGCFLCQFQKFAKLQKKKRRWNFLYGNVVGLQHPNLLKWNPTKSVFLGITDIIFWGFFRNNY